MFHNLKLLITIALVFLFNGIVIGYPVKRDQRSHTTSRPSEHGRVRNITGHGDAKVKKKRGKQIYYYLILI